jgi:2-polyprenyl-6-methoxyphenol hydroxylase-like FAD-dependent oxidoreductase
MPTGKIAAMFIHRTSGLVPPAHPALHLSQIYGDLKWCVPTLLRHAAVADDLRYEPAAQIKLPAWHRGRIGLLGDACHAYSLLPGQGASVAMDAAFWLGTEMIRAPSVEAAFSWYQNWLSSEIASRRASTRRAAHWLVPATRTDLAMRNGLLRLARVPGVARFLQPVVTGIA